MPTILTKNGFRLFFYSQEGNEPIHVHVAYAGNIAKFWLKPDVVLATNIGLKTQEIKKAKDIINGHLSLIEEKWDEYSRRKQDI